MRLRPLSILFAVFASFTIAADGQQIMQSPESISDRADKYLAEYNKAGDFSGVVLIAQGDRVLFRKAYGFANPVRKIPNAPDTVFRIASLSKTFTAAAVALLIEQGKVKLTDPLERYFSGIPNGDRILVRHLLLHKSGVGQLDSADIAGTCLSTDKLIGRLRESKPRFEPGTGDRYSNEGYILLAGIIEKVSGISYSSFLKKHIFDPLKMKATHTMCLDWPVEDHATGTIAGLGGGETAVTFKPAGQDGPGSVVSNVDDLWIWLRAVNSDSLFKFSELEYPYGWGRRNYSGRPLVEQTGIIEGFTAHVALYPGEQIYLVFLNNVQSGLTNRIPEDFESLLFGGKLSSPPVAKEVNSSKEVISEFEGEFETADIPVPLRLVERKGKLWMRWGESPFFRPLLMISKDTFYLRAEYATFTFERDVNGRIAAMEYSFTGGDPFHLSKRR